MGLCLIKKTTFQTGLTYLYVSPTTFSVNLEQGEVFTPPHGFFPYQDQHLLMYLGFLNSEPVRLLLKVINPDRLFQSNYVRLLPLHPSINTVPFCKVRHLLL